MKTARFTELVKKAGAPNSYLLWVPPKEDKVFQRAVKEQRILTIHQENVGTKKTTARSDSTKNPTRSTSFFRNR